MGNPYCADTYYVVFHAHRIILTLLVVAAIGIVPLYRLLGRIGLARGWAFVALFPPFGMILLWVIAFMRWPQPAATNSGPA